jgi:hypothetical protein
LICCSKELSGVRGSSELISLCCAFGLVFDCGSKGGDFVNGSYVPSGLYEPLNWRI